MWEETDVTFSIPKGVKNSNMRYFPNLLFSSSFVWFINTFSTLCIVNHDMGPLAYVNSLLDGGALCPGVALCPMLLYHSCTLILVKGEHRINNYDYRWAVLFLPTLFVFWHSCLSERKHRTLTSYSRIPNFRHPFSHPFAAWIDTCSDSVCRIRSHSQPHDKSHAVSGHMESPSSVYMIFHFVRITHNACRLRLPGIWNPSFTENYSIDELQCT